MALHILKSTKVNNAHTDYFSILKDLDSTGWTQKFD